MDGNSPGQLFNHGLFLSLFNDLHPAATTACSQPRVCVCVGQRQNINYLAVCGSLLAVCGSRLAMYVWVIAGIVRNFVGVIAPL